MTPLRLGSLFSGFGGLDLAVESVLGAETVWHCENDRAASLVLARHWPGVPNLGDITEVDWATVPPVDVLAGGSPCQGLSLAGRQAGMADTRSGLWSYMAAAIAALRPGLVIWENVRGALSTPAGDPISDEGDEDGETAEAVRDLGRDGLDYGPGGPARAFGVVLAELAELGYDATWCGLPASAVGACHGRFRVFLVATPADAGGGTPTDAERDAVREQPEPEPGCCGAPVAGLAGPDAGIDWREWGPAVRRWESLTRPAPSPVEPGPRGGRPRLAPAFPEWMMGLPAGWITDLVDHPDPALRISRNDALRLAGNGVVPQQAAAALPWLLAQHFGREAAA